MWAIPGELPGAIARQYGGYLMNARFKEKAGQLYEQVLVLRCQTGDDTAFAELLGRYEKRLGHYVRRLLHPAESPEDVLQDTWLAVYRKLPELRDLGAFKVWLYRVARNAALTRMRRRRDWAELAQEPQTMAENSEHTVVLAEDIARLHAALDRLSAGHREALTLRFLEEMSYEDIACVVGCSVGTVRSRLHYARQSLERELRGQP